MGYANGKITAPVATEDVISAIGTNSHDVAILCMSGNVNKWAKYKPEATGSYQTLTLEQRKTNNFGLASTGSYLSVTQFIEAVQNGTYNGGWIRVNLTANHWKRLDDFVGYFHNAVSPFGSLTNQTFELSGELIVPAIAPPPVTSSDDGQIHAEDLAGLVDGVAYKDYYFGILLWNSAHTLIATSTTTIGESSSWQVNFGSVGNSYKGTYNAVPFLSSVKITAGGSYPASIRIVGTGGDTASISLLTTSDMYKFAIRCMYVGSTSTSIEYKVSITNSSKTSVNFTNVLLQVATSGTGANSKTAYLWGSTTVPANTAWSREGTVDIASKIYTHARLYTARGSSDWVPFLAEAPDNPLE